MKNFLEKACPWIIAAVFIICVFGASWLLMCGIVKLITLCFGWTFSWGIATGVWLIDCLLIWSIARGGKDN